MLHCGTLITRNQRTRTLPQRLRVSHCETKDGDIRVSMWGSVAAPGYVNVC
jgi:hypothetical protein